MYKLAEICSGSCANAWAKASVWGELRMANFFNSCGFCAAKLQATAPPQSWAISAWTGAPKAWITAHTSAKILLGLYASSCAGCEDKLKPRKSIATQR